MNHKKIFLLAIITILNIQQTRPIIVQASVYKKNCVDGKHDIVYIFDDVHLHTGNQPSELVPLIKENAKVEQEIILQWALKLNAQILVEDLFDYEPHIPVISWFPHLVSWLTAHYSSLMAESFLANMIAQAKKKNIATYNIETRQNGFVAFEFAIASALLLALSTRILETATMANLSIKDFFVNHWGKIATTVGIMGASVLYPLSLQLYKQHCLTKSYQDNKSLKDYAQELKNNYKELTDESLVTQYSGWTVDMQALTKILDNSAHQIHFVCAGQEHTNNISVFLEQQGYSLHKRIGANIIPSLRSITKLPEEFAILIALGLQTGHLNPKKPLDISSFMENCMQELHDPAKH